LDRLFFGTQVRRLTDEHVHVPLRLPDDRVPILQSIELLLLAPCVVFRGDEFEEAVEAFSVRGVRVVRLGELEGERDVVWEGGAGGCWRLRGEKWNEVDAGDGDVSGGVDSSRAVGGSGE
jgi:hypothetical protein